MRPAAIITRPTALRMLGDRAHLIDGLPLVVDRAGVELGFFAGDVEALRDGRWQAKRYAAARVERIATK